MKHKTDANSLKLKKWICHRPGANLKRLQTLLEKHDQAGRALTHVLRGEQFPKLRRDLVKELKLK